jgi:hypothetical protein
MSGRRLPGLLFAVFVTGCTALTPFPTGPLAADPNVKDPGPRVAICYNSMKTPPEKVQELGQAQCSGNTTAEKVDVDYRLDDCPVLTPARATFVCKPAK